MSVVNFTSRPPYHLNYRDRLFYGFPQTLGKCRDISTRPLRFRILNNWTDKQTRLRAGRSRVRIPAGQEVYLVAETSRPAVSCRVKCCGVKLTTHLHLVPRLRMSENIPPLTLYIFKTYTTLSCLTLLIINQQIAPWKSIYKLSF